jgi:hypothetical protein
VIRDGDGAEDPKEFESLLQRFYDALQPVGALEESLVERIVVCYWRLRRAQRFEVGAIRQQLDDCNRPPTFPKGGYVEHDLEHDLERAQTALAPALKALAWAEQEEDLTTFKSWEVLDSAWDAVAREYGVDNIRTFDSAGAHQGFLTYLKDRGVTEDQIQQLLLEAQRGLIEAARKRIEELENKLVETRRYDKLALERAALLYALPDQDNVNKLIRYETAINRQLDRALNQLERLQRTRQGEHTPAPVTMDVNVTGVRRAG